VFSNNKKKKRNQPLEHAAIVLLISWFLGETSL